MAEEPKEVAPQAPAPEQAAAPVPQAPAASAAPAAPVKKSNVGVIILVVVLVVVIIGGGISYGIYRFVKNRVKNAVSDVASVAGVSTDTTNLGSDTNDYSAVKDVTPTDDLSKSANSSIKPILEKLFGGAKLTLWSAMSEGATLSYTTKNAITSADYTNIETAFVNAGYTKQGNYNSADSFIAYFDKGNESLYITSTSSNTFSAVVSKTTADTSASE